jgi:hypothetical protein
VTLGIIAEDDSDVAVIRELTLSMLNRIPVGVKKFVGHGSGKLRRKCGVWASNLARQGCTCIVVVHDLDFHDAATLRKTLTDAIAGASARSTIVLLPEREIEAWLLYDAGAIRAAFGGNRKPALPGDPESIIDPKKHLERLIWKLYRTRYLSTVHNEAIAKCIDTAKLKRSRSFAPHVPFVNGIRKSLR